MPENVALKVHFHPSLTRLKSYEHLLCLRKTKDIFSQIHTHKSQYFVTWVKIRFAKILWTRVRDKWQILQPLVSIGYKLRRYISRERERSINLIPSHEVHLCLQMPRRDSHPSRIILIRDFRKSKWHFTRGSTIPNNVTFDG